MAFGDEVIISGFMGEAISRCTDFSWIKIKEAVKDRKNKHKNMESQIYNVIVNVINQITYNKFENNQDKIYQATEKLLIGYKNSKCDSIEVVKSGLQILGENINNDKYIEFKKLLYQELGKDDYEELNRQIRLFQQDEESSKASRIEYSVNEVKQDVREIKQVVLNEKNANVENSSTIQNIKLQNNKKQKYIENWNSRLFLHIDNDENPITLSNAFIVPQFDYYIKVGSIKFSDKDLLTDAIEKFIQYDKTSNLLITGFPGIGKTSIISWIADKYKDDEDIIILRFRDWSNNDLAKGLFSTICNSLNCESVDLENKVLIIDGFDEIKSVNERKSLIHEFFNDILDFENLKVIITSRPDYLATYDFQNVFKVLPFDITRIKEFYQIILGEELDQSKIDRNNLDVLGIPVILYMAIMTDIDLTLKTTKPELYNQIFAERGGIFDRLCFNGIGYDGGLQPLRVKNNVKIYLNFLQRVAFSMFEKNDLVLTEKEYDIPELMFQGEKLSVIEFPIKTFFESDGYNVEFIHKSIYEYFVSEYIFSSLLTVINTEEEKIASILGELLKSNDLSLEILEFLKYKIRNSKLNNVYDKAFQSFKLMLQDGMTYYTGVCYKNVIKCEMNVFSNMLEILHLWEDCSLEFDYLINDYLKYNKKIGLNFQGTKFIGSLKGAVLEEAELIGANLEGAKLIGVNAKRVNLKNANLKEVDFGLADLTGANLQETNLIEANLRESILVKADLTQSKLMKADLREVDLQETNLEKAYLQGAKLDINQVYYLDNKYDLKNIKVYTGYKGELLDYKEYCKRYK